MSKFFTRAGTAGRVGALAAAGALVLAGCAESSLGGANGGGTSVAYGATKAEYQAAFADMDTILLHTQSPGAKGSVAGSFVEKYVDAVEDWSGGKLTFEVAYSDAIAKATEIDDAIGDGRLDMGQVLTVYEPKEFPASAALLDAGVLSDQGVVTGTMQSNAWPAEVAFSTPEIVAEFEDKGLHLMMPAYNAGVNALFCAEPTTGLGDFAGKSISVGSTVAGEQVSALGATSTSVAYTEAYEALQRGVIDCAMVSPSAAQIGGLIEVAPHTVIDPAAGLAVPTGNMVFNSDLWDNLPLAARQLLWDRLDVFLGASIEDKIWPVTANVVQEIEQFGGAVAPFAGDAGARLTEANDKIVDGIAENSALDGAAFATAVREKTRKWSDIIADLGYENDTDYNGFGEWFSPGKIDIDPYVQRVFEEVLLDRRPA
ncbi:TRAP transporter substrate-binding protein DctP [Nocardia carnea]|uniref:TRAP transporter substrate-binding protein DctP n=1 Tax=Nocardia carnea TaxID=37328 RepID=A0ABW7TRS7_9NOCA|nr:TRAP transporter substrate-binding protein DctP [Nocardia carnea]